MNYIEKTINFVREVRLTHAVYVTVITGPAEARRSLWSVVAVKAALREIADQRLGPSGKAIEILTNQFPYLQ
jgi:hypothetical protein